MKRTFATRIILPLILATVLMIINQCAPAPEWKAKNDELIKQYSLTGRELPGCQNKS
jgi:hypothetical protein